MSPELSPDLITKLHNTRVVLSDVDGVMTDGGLYCFESGDVAKKFNVKDGIGLLMMQAMGIKVGIVTTENKNLVAQRAQWLKVDYLFMGISRKDEVLQRLQAEDNIAPEHVAFVADEINDLRLLKLCGLKLCVADAVRSVQQIVDMVLQSGGGQGALRELAELLMQVKGLQGDGLYENILSLAQYNVSQ